jgi:CHAT domain-containing protein/tetratricopeptide (TPR) repeat protein
MVRFALSSAGWLCTIGLLTTTIPVLALSERSTAQASQTAEVNPTGQIKDGRKSKGLRSETVIALGSDDSQETQKAEEGRILQQCRQNQDKNQYEAAIISCNQALVKFRQLKNLIGEAKALGNLGNAYDSLGNYVKAIEYSQQSLAIAHEIKNRQLEVATLGNLGVTYNSLGDYAKAIEYGQRALAIAREIKDRQIEGMALVNLGATYDALDDYTKAIDYSQQALTIAREIKDRQIAGAALGNLGNAYRSLGNYAKGNEYSQQALAAAREIKNRQYEGAALVNLGLIHNSLGDYIKAIEYQQQALTIAREIKDRQNEGKAVANLGDIYYSLGNYEKVIEYHQQSLTIAREVKNRQNEGNALGSLGLAYCFLGDCAKTIDYEQEWLKIAREIKHRRSEGKALGNLGLAYCLLGDCAKGIDYEQQSLTIAREVRDRQSEGNALGNLGNAYYALGNYAKMIDYEQQALTIAREIRDRQSEGDALNSLGNAYYALGNYAKAIEYQQQALTIAHETKESRSEGQALGNIGNAYYALGNYTKAIEYQQQALAIVRETKDRRSESKALSGLGNTYYSLGNYAKAIEYHQQALTIAREIRNRQSEGKALGNLGNAYDSLGDYAKAIEYQQQSLTIAREIGGRESEGLALSNMGNTLVRRGRSELAIIFYKQSVNVRETIRTAIRTLPRESQDSYTQSIANTYRALAVLLIEQSRIGEAQQVLELLKIQELKDFDPVVRAKVNRNGKTIELDNSEKKIVSEHDTYIAFAQKLQECEDKNEGCKELKDKRVAAKADYDKVVQSFEQEIKDRKIKDEKNFLDPKNPLNAKAQEIIQAQPNTALIYTLVTEKRLWIVLATQSEVLRSFEVNVTQAELSKTVAEFQNLTNRCELRNCTAADTAAFKVVSQQLHTWLFPKDLQTELQGTKTTPKIEHLVFALDRVTRYIPMSALFDGQKYLIQDYTVTTIVSADSTRSERLPDTSNTKVLAFGFSNALPPDFLKPLTAVVGELNSILRDETDATDKTLRFPGRKFLNEQFTTANLEQYLPKRQILHIATHGEFVGGSQEQSYIVLGDGRKLKISEMLKLYGLPGVNLVVLSACQTALASKDSTGVEISSVGNAFFEKGVKSVVASLWNVNDGSTSLLMQEFYKHLAEGKTKTAALREAQLDLMTGQKTEKDVPRGNDADVKLTQKPGTTRAPTNQPTDYRHPYYWAPFILIGNGL